MLIWLLKCWAFHSPEIREYGGGVSSLSMNPEVTGKILWVVKNNILSRVWHTYQFIYYNMEIVKYIKYRNYKIIASK